MIREAAEQLWAVLGQLVTILATGGTAVMVFAFAGRQLGLTGVAFWQAFSVVLAGGLLLGFTVTVVRLDRQAERLLFDAGLYVISGNAFLSEEREKQDTRHRISQLRQHVDLTDGGQNVVVTERYEGRNVDEELSEAFQFYFNSETYIQDNEVTVTQEVDGEEVPRALERVDADGEFTGSYTVEFVEPLAKGETFTLEVTSQLGNWDLSDGEYLFTDCNRFTNGVGDLKYSVELASEPETATAYRAVSHAEMVHHRDPMKLDFNIDEIDIEHDSTGLEYWIRQHEVSKSVFIIELRW